MRRSASSLGLVLAVVVLTSAAGCQTAGVRLLSLIGLEKPPLSVALVMDRPAAAAEAINPFPSYAALQKLLADHLGQPVAVDVCFPFQVDPGFATGWYDFAVLTPAQYADLAPPSEPKVIAISVDKQGRTARCAVLVVPTASAVQSPADLRGQVVAFGPAGDTRTHYAALRLLTDAGLKPTDLALEFLPVPHSLKHYPSMRGVAQAVINGRAAAGFVDEAAWEAFPGHDEREGEPAQDKLRIIGRTCALPDYLVVAAPTLDEATARRVQAFLLAVGKEHPEAFEPLMASGYQTPSVEMLATCHALRGIEQRPAETQPADPAAIES